MLLDKLTSVRLAKQLPAGVISHGTPVTPAVLTAAAQGYPAQNLSSRRGLLGGMYRAVKTITGNEWFGPMQPLPPIAPDDYQARLFDYQFGINMRVQPRTEQDGVSFQQMIALADNYDVLRLVIETRKDQLAKFPLTFKLKANAGEKVADLKVRTLKDARIKQLTEFWKKPDGVNVFQAWLRALLEDLFVIDAVTVFPRRTLGGDIWSVDLLAGETIRRLVDAQGRTPAPPSKAYQQIIHGIVADDYTTEEMLYCPRNVRTRRLYGQSIVEQIILTVNMALRRQMSKLAYYTEGNIPEMLIQAPEAWPAEEIKKFQAYFDALAGDIAAQRRVRWIPESKGVTQIKDAMLKDEMDEWLARVVCYAFSVPPTPFVKVQNRAVSQQLQEAAIQEGLLPLQSWMIEIINQIIQAPYLMNQPDIEASWQDEEDPDPAKRNQVEINDVSKGIRSIDDVLEDRGEDPIGMGHCIITGTGPVMLKPFIEGKLTGVASIDSPAPPAGPGVDLPGGSAAPATPGQKPGLIQRAVDAHQKLLQQSNGNGQPAQPAKPAQPSARTPDNPSGRQTTAGLTTFGKLADAVRMLEDLHKAVNDNNADEENYEDQMAFAQELDGE